MNINDVLKIPPVAEKAMNQAKEIQK